MIRMEDDLVNWWTMCTKGQRADCLCEGGFSFYWLLAMERRRKKKKMILFLS